jgi:ABC-2 type transport system ATP-binding protein
MIEAPTFYPHLSGYDNLRMIAYSSGSPEARINEELSRVDLLGSANEPFRTYSLGMKQRLGVAAALLKDPQILILDEPTNGLDPHSVVNIREVILEFRRRGRTVLFSSHQLSDIERLCDRIGVINKGKLVAQGTVSSICGNSGVSIVAEPLGTVRTIVSQFAQGRKVVVQEDRIWVDLDSNHYFTLLQALDDAGVTIRKFEVGTRSLEDVFFELVGPSMPVVPLR